LQTRQLIEQPADVGLHGAELSSGRGSGYAAAAFFACRRGSGMGDREQGQFGLLRARRFGPFFITQTLGAFNDNVFKNALVILVTFGIAGLSADQVNLYVNLAAGLFILPFFLFSATAGQIAEKYEKSRLIRGIKL